MFWGFNRVYGFKGLGFRAYGLGFLGLRGLRFLGFRLWGLSQFYWDRQGYYEDIHGTVTRGK